MDIDDVIVSIGGGKVRGRRADGVDAFLGVPYAEAPAGERRWQAPEPRRPWDGTLDATAHGPAAWQPTGGPLDGLVPGMDVGPQGDDCLRLAVWTPAADEGHRPVMVWIHGGAFTVGAGSLPAYDGACLAAEQDVVVVSVNYRVGALGFLHPTDPSATPNTGLLDQVEALRWVRREIAAFGGDPDAVTIFGESAGGGSVLSLLSMPATSGLFQRAIVQSGATGLLLDPEKAAEVLSVLCRNAGVADGDVEALRALPVEDLLAAQQATSAELIFTIGTMPFHPSVDGEVLPQSWLDAARSGVNAVPLLIGTTADEMGLFASMDPNAHLLDADGLARRLDRTGLDPATVVGAYATAGITEPPAIWRRFQTDQQMWVPMLRIAEGRAAHAPVFSYRFDWPAGADATAVHGADIPFAFGTTDGWAGFLHELEGAAALSATIRSHWAAFARSGDPSTADRSWPTYDPDGDRATLFLDADPRVVADPDAPVRIALEALTD